MRLCIACLGDAAFAPLEAAYRDLGDNGQQYARCRTKVTQ
jgi:hypothetical protein